MSSGYIQLPLTVDPSSIQQAALESIAASLPGWVPRESHIEVLLLEQFAAMAAESANVASQVDPLIFSYFGSLINITPEQGSQATAATTWTMRDSLGYTVPAGTSVGYQILGNQLYTFQTTNSFTVPSGSTQANNVNIQATEVGAFANGLTPQNLTLITSLSFVASISSTTTSAGGADVESTTNYLNRLSQQLQLLSPRPILPSDFAVLATNTPGVARAAAYNLLNPFANDLTTEDSTFSGGIGQWQPLSIGRNITGVSVSSGSTTLTGTGFVSTDANRLVNVPGVPTGTTVAAYVNSTQLTLSQNATITGSSLSGHLGDLVSSSGATLSNATGTHGESCLEIAPTGTGNAVAGTYTGSMQAIPAYECCPGSIHYAVCSLDEPVSTSPTVTLSIYFYDVNNNYISQIDSQAVTTSSSGYTAVYASGVAPANSHRHALVVSVNGPSAGNNEFVAWASLVECGAIAPTNYVPDSSMLNVATNTSWTLDSGLSQAIFQTDTYSASYTGTGSASGTKTASSQFFYLPAGSYILSSYLDSTNISSGNVTVDIKYGSTTAASISQALGVAGTVSAAFSLGSAEMVQCIFSTNNCTVEAGLPLIFAEPQIVAVAAPYTQGPTYTPPNMQTNNERVVTVAVVDSNGDALSASQMLAIQQSLDAQREVNFIVYVIGPTYTLVDVTWSAVCHYSSTPAVVLAAGNAALNSYLSPANWGISDTFPGNWTPISTILRYLDVVTVLGSIPGIDYLTSVKIGFHNGPLGTSDLTLLGSAPLTSVGTILGNVTSDPLSGE